MLAKMIPEPLFIFPIAVKNWGLISNSWEL